MNPPDLSALTVSRPAAWLMDLPKWVANGVCGVSYLLVAGLMHLVFALPNPLPVAGSAAAGVAVAGALLCGRQVLPGLWLARFVWDLCLNEGPISGQTTALAALGASALVLQTEVARLVVLALQILPSKLRRLRKSIQIAGAGFLASCVGSGVYLAALAVWPDAPAVPHWGMQAAALVFPEWAGIAIVLPLTILWLQDNSWHEARKWRVTALVALAGALALGLTARALWTDERAALARLQESNQALAQRISADLQAVATSVQILQTHLRASPRTLPRDFADMAQAIRTASPHLHALSWNPVITLTERAAFESRLRGAYGPGAALRDRRQDGSLAPSANAEFYVAVEHIAPLELNRPALGLNIYANPVRRAAIDHAISSGQPAMTGRIQLAQETGNSWGALYLSPLYPDEAAASALPAGFAVAVLRIESLVGTAVENLRFRHAEGQSEIAPAKEAVVYRFADHSEAPEGQTLFESATTLPPAASSPWHRLPMLTLPPPPISSQPVSFGNRQYRFEAQPAGDFWETQVSRTPFLTLSVGIFFTWVSLVASLVLSGSTQLLTIAVEKRTRQLQAADTALQHTNGRLQERSVQLRSVLEATDQGYLGFDADGGLVLGNEKAFDLITLPPGEERQSYVTVARHIGRNFQLAQAQALSVTQSMLSVRNNKEHHVYRDLVPARVDTPARYLDMRVHAFEDPLLRTIVLLHDTTPEMQLERSKSQFMSFAAHEIRTPLTVIHGYADLLATREQSAATAREMGQQILRKSQGLNQLLQRMLDLSELDMNGLDVKRTRNTDLGALCANVVRNLELPEGREPAVLVHYDPIPWCRVDPAAITMAVTELLHNAYAFSPKGSQVSLSVGPLNGDPDNPVGVRIRIQDQGQGMTHEVQQHIFERFYRADSSGKHPGFGLGLSTAKLISDLHKAQLTIESTPQEGTVVSIDIPQGNV